MCTAVTYQTKDLYFGRTLDLEYSYNEEVVVTPRNYPLFFRDKGVLERHHAIVGMATVADGYPLYYEAANEHGLAMAGLNFPGNACYFEKDPQKDNITPFELIPWILGQCENLTQAREKLKKLNLWKENFSDALPLSPLHWMVADPTGAITVESVAEGLKIHENPVGVLTNNPTFDYHMTRLCDFGNLSRAQPEIRFGNTALTPYSRGMGAMGLPGDLSSVSRFVRATFTKCNSVSGDGEAESVSQFFHILGTVEQTRGCVRLPDGRDVITVYTSCINTQKGIYYYTTYENRSISAVDMRRCDPDGGELFRLPLNKKPKIYRQN